MLKLCAQVQVILFILCLISSEIQLKPQSTVLMILAVPDSSRYEG